MKGLRAEMRPNLFKILFFLTVCRLGMDIINVTYLDISIPNLIRSFIPSFSLAVISFAFYYFHREELHLGAPSKSEAGLLVAAFFSGLLTALIIHQIISNFTTAGTGNILIILISVLGLIGVLVLSAMDISLGVCGFIVLLPFFLLVHIAFWELDIFPDDLGGVVINPEILLIILVFVFLFPVLLRQRKEFFHSKLNILLIILIGSGAVSALCSYDVSFSLKMIFAGVLIPVACYYLIVNSISSHEELKKVIIALLISFFLIGSYSVLYIGRNFVYHDLLSGAPYRVDPFFANPDLYGPVLVLALPLTLALSAIPAIPFHLRIFAICTSFILFCSLVFSFNRGAWLGFMVSVMVLFFLSPRARRVFVKLLSVLIVVFLLAEGFILNIFWARTYSLDEFLQSNSYLGRLASWGSAVQMMKHNPLTGIGPGMFKLFFRDYEGGRFSLHLSDAENLFLHTGAEMGMINMFILIAIFAVCLRSCYCIAKSKDPFNKVIGSYLFAGLIGFLVVSNMSGTILAKYSMNQDYFFAGHSFYLFIFLGLITALDRAAKIEPQKSEREQK